MGFGVYTTPVVTAAGSLNVNRVHSTEVVLSLPKQINSVSGVVQVCGIGPSCFSCSLMN